MRTSQEISREDNQAVMNDDEMVLCCDQKLMAKKKRDGARRRGKFRQIISSADMSKAMMIQMKHDVFNKIIEAQLAETCIWSNNANFQQLGLMKRFKDELWLKPNVWKDLEHYEIEEPTAIQQVLVPYFTQFDGDLIVKSQTGSGKTFAFLLPIVEYIIQAKEGIADQTPNRRNPYAIIVAPTRELVWQLALDANRITSSLYNVNVAYGFGDLAKQESKALLDNGCDILIVTPGRLYDYFHSKEVYQNPRCDTQNVKFVVLDECDKLLAAEHNNHSYGDMPSTSRILNDLIVDKLTIKEKNRNKFRVILLTATLGASGEPSAEMLKLVVPNNLVNISVGGNFPVSTVRQSFIESTNPHTQVDLFMEFIKYIAERDDCYDPKTGDIKKFPKTIIFTNTIVDADRLTLTLISNFGLAVAAITSSLMSRIRMEMMLKFMKNELDVIVTTDVLSRGLNFPHVDLVINYHFPNEVTEYVHRVGRCGRIGNFGDSITFFNPLFNYRAAPDLIKGLRSVKQEVPKFLLHCFHNPEVYAYEEGRVLRERNGRRRYNNDTGYQTASSE